MRTALILGTILSLTTLATKANADPFYSVTDLGQQNPSYDYGAVFPVQTDLSGYVHSVTNSAGTVTYAFDKSPVTHIDERYDGGAHLYSYTDYTLQNGNYKVGYWFDYGNTLPGPTYTPTFLPSSSGWSSGSPSQLVSDMNIQGQVVGMSNPYDGTGGPFAAFSHLATKPFEFASVDNLNNDIVPIPGVRLTWAEMIDDSGRIIAQGSNNDAYLLTPTSLGPPQTVPEPTTLILAGIIGSWMGVRSLRRRGNMGHAKYRGHW